MRENLLDYVRIALYTVLIILGFFLYQAWEKDHPATDAPAANAAQTMPGSRYVPDTSAVPASAANTASPSVPAAAPQTVGQLVHVTTDLLDVTIDTRGGDIVSVKLLDYPESLSDPKQAFVLLNDDAKTRYLAESGLLSTMGPDTSKGQALYTTAQTSYTLAPDQDELTVTLNWKDDKGLAVAKNFTFNRNSYEINVGYAVQNKTPNTWQGNLYTQLMRTDTPPVGSGGFINLATYFGAAFSTPAKPFQKLSFSDIKKESLNTVSQGGWAAMLQHYFISAWIPAQTATSTYYSKVTPDGLYTIGMIGQPLVAAPGATVETQAKLYAGPTLGDQLEKAAPSLKLTIDYGWFWFISAIIFWMMQKIYDVVGNWGWSIVIVTIIIKLIFYKLSAKSYRSMSGLKKLQPRIEMLKERYGDDKQKLTQATLELYKQEKVNPMSGCLPILVQIPVFIALYWVLVESVQLRQAPFILWIHDLSQQDPYYILPVLMGLSMFVQQRLNPPPPDPLQAKLMMLMPVVFTVLFANFPAGLMLYWFVNNTLSFLQQWYIMRSVEK